MLKYLLSQTQPAEIPQKCELIPRQAELLGETDRKKMRVENVERTHKPFIYRLGAGGGGGAGEFGGFELYHDKIYLIPP